MSSFAKAKHHTPIPICTESHESLGIAVSCIAQDNSSVCLKVVLRAISSSTMHLYCWWMKDSLCFIWLLYHVNALLLYGYLPASTNWSGNLFVVRCGPSKLQSASSELCQLTTTVYHHIVLFSEQCIVQKNSVGAWTQVHIHQLQLRAHTKLR